MGGIRIARIAGIEVRVHPSWIVIFALVTMSLATAVFPMWHPSWGPATRWSVAGVAAALFFGSVLVHEFAHSLVGRWQGIDVSSITLFLFGGVSNLSDEPESARSELLMTIVGPLASLVIGMSATSIAFELGAPSAPADFERAMEHAGVAATTLYWLGSINVLLAIFNMLPAYPLDGGRVVHSALWAWLHDRLRATEIASTIGRGFGVGLVAIGMLMIVGFQVPVFGTGAVGGIWLVLIGMFLSQAARGALEMQRAGDEQDRAEEESHDELVR